MLPGHVNASLPAIRRSQTFSVPNFCLGRTVCTTSPLIRGRPWSAALASEVWPPPVQVCITPRCSETSSRSRDPFFGCRRKVTVHFFWVPPKSDSSDSDIEPEPNWVAKQFIASARLPLRFYLDAGSEEIDLSGGGRSILLTNRSLRDVLRARGYELHYQEFAGGHDYLSWRGTLADGLIALMGGASTQPGQESAVKP